MKQYTIGKVGGNGESSRVPNRRVLLVDEDPLMRVGFKQVLREWSFAPSVAGGFREARNIVVTEEPFGVIVSDYHLPDGNGLELLDWLKRELGVQVPFLLISDGLPRAPSAVDGYEFLSKFFLIDNLRNRLEKLCRVKPQTATSFKLTVAQEAMASVYAFRWPPRNE
jgi:DNA-binding NtrC family response regulator